MKSLYAAAIGSLLIFSASCSGGKTADSNAQQLFDDASAAFEATDYTRATALLDSLQKNYPAEVELQRQGMALRPKVIEKATLLKISTNDSLSTLAQLSAQQSKGKLKWIKTPRMVEGYWVASQGYNADFMNTTGIQGRVSEIGEFYIVSSAKPSVNHTSIALSNGSETVATETVPYDGESNYRINGGEIITFSPQQSDTIGQFAAANAGRPLTLSFRGKASKSVKLTAQQVAALADAYTYAHAVTSGRDLATERQRLEATLQVARNQIAKLSEEPAEK
jgi:hypothetical protein